MSSVTNFFEGFEDYAEGITKEELEFDDFTVDIAIKLRKLREAAGLTQRKAAEHYGCTPQQRMADRVFSRVGRECKRRRKYRRLCKKQ